MNHTRSNVLVDSLSQDRSLTRHLLWTVGFALVTALMAQVEFRLPFTPVPLTGQTFAVLLSGVVLGSRRAFASQTVYLASGAAGLPVFAGGGSTILQLLGPTGGYLWSFPLAAALTGWLVERGASRKAWKLALALLLSDALILASGTLWLRAFFGAAPHEVWPRGFYPFLIGDALKIALVGATFPGLLRRCEPRA
jgi:biotin transport system substrate-specific component